jgi:thioredoxin-dependent peroxiredoxin
MLATGDQFPDFELINHEGDPRSFHDYSGSWLVLFAFPASGKSCDNQALSFEARYNEFKTLGVEVVGLAPHAQKKLANFVKKHDLSYALLSDPDNELLEALEVWGEKKMVGKTVEGVMRSTFLVNPNGDIAKVWETIKVAGHVDAVLEAVTETVTTTDEEHEDVDEDDSDESDENESNENEEETDELADEESKGQEDDTRSDEESDDEEKKLSSSTARREDDDH